MPKQHIASDADMILEPLMELLDVSLVHYSQQCEKTVLKKLLKELWKITMCGLEKIVVLPSFTDKNVEKFLILAVFSFCNYYFQCLAS